MIKPVNNPLIISPAGSSIEDFAGKWWVAHTKSRNEKALAKQLQKKNISYFLPMIEKVYKRRRRVFRSVLPLFSGYVFFCGSEENRLDALKTNRIANIIPVQDQRRFVNELLPIEKALLSGVDLAPHTYIKEGQRCKVIAGSLIGTEGIVVRQLNRTRLVLQVDMLGKATSLDIDADLLEMTETDS